MNTLRRLRYASAIGCDSADGTLLRFDPAAPVAAWLEGIHRQPTLGLP